MAIHALGLENFKRFSKFSIELSRPVTVILGENSSGKSSILKSLLALKQTASTNNEHESWAAQGDYVDLGVYQDYVHKKDVRKKFKIKLSLGPEFVRKLTLARRVVDGATGLEIEFNYDHDPITSQARILAIRGSYSHGQGLYSWELCRQKTRKNYALSLSRDLTESFNRLFPMPGSEKPLKEGESVVVAHDEKLTFRSTSAGRRLAHQFSIRIVNDTISSLSAYLDRNLFYLAPLRAAPYRSYVRSSHSLTVGVKGEYTPSVLANLERRTQKVTRGESLHKTNLELLQRWIDAVFPGYQIRAKAFDELVKLYVANGDTESYLSNERADTLTDVGFGFSQVVPILVQLAVMPPGSTLIIEQPELHLHPKAQTRLATVVGEAAAAGRRVIVETHSEHFVRGLQLAVSSGRGKKTPRLSADMVNFFYLKQRSSQVERLSMSKYGEFEQDWPSGFFDESYRAIKVLLANKLRGE